MPRRLLVDAAPLRQSPAFRRYWIGSGLSAIGTQMTMFAITYQVFTMTNSSFAVGAVGLCSAVPAIGFGMLAGTIGDAVDRRRLVLITSLALAGVSALFAVQAFLDLRQLWLLYVLTVVESLIVSVNVPARRTFTPRLLPTELLPAGAALNMMTMHLSNTLGPLLAGAVAAVGGLKACYVIDVLSFGAALYGVFRLPPMPPEGTLAKPGMTAVVQAVGFIRGSQVLTGAVLADLFAMTLGAPFALFPAINAAFFGGGPQTLGLLNAAPAIGGVLGSALSGPVGHVSRQGRAMLLAGACWAITLIGFGLSTTLWLSVALLVVGGACDVISVVFRTTILQVATPDRYRSRIGAAEYVVGYGGAQLGNFRAGTVASLTTPGLSAVIGGLSTIAGAVALWRWLPGFAAFRAEIAFPDDQATTG
ncbi:MFS transporter [Kutzneria sp. CA-103260]|uniref:MFS transporter n=1 Tax=Kutzneria sp. CA-103260 TaxID=2802641 RepID=UPI0020135DF9|nr:MFS transporter [Kutzneria sp. CA-103260]